MKPGSSRAFFDAIAGRYDRAYSLGSDATRVRMERVLSALPPAPATLLDLGVGTGRELPWLLDAGYAVTGLDVSPAMLAICARRARAIPLVEADLWGPLPFGDASFDVVLALHGTLAHPSSGPDPHGSLARELARLIRAGGALVAEVPSRDWLVGIVALEDDDSRIERTGKDTCVHEDKIAHVAIEATIPTDAEWQRAFGPWFDVACEAIGEGETRMVATRRL